MVFSIGGAVAGAAKPCLLEKALEKDGWIAAVLSHTFEAFGDTQLLL